MVRVRPFEVLFLTNFSDSCFRAIPALAQLGDEVDLRLTILHAFDEARSDRSQLEANIRSFFPEADNYAGCRRLLVPGSPVDAVQRLRAERPVDLIVAPAGDPLGLPRFGHTSLRTRLVRDTGTPILTMGAGTRAKRLAQPTRTVACCVDLDATGFAHLRLAADYARSLNATLKIVHVLPEIDEGSIVSLAYAEPFDARAAARQLRRAGAFVESEPEVHVASRDALHRKLAQLSADVVFLDGRRWMSGGWFSSRMSRMVDAMPCPGVCVDPSRLDLQWNLPRNLSRAARASFAFEMAPARAGEFALTH